MTSLRGRETKWLKIKFEDMNKARSERRQMLLLKKRDSESNSVDDVEYSPRQAEKKYTALCERIHEIPEGGALGSILEGVLEEVTRQHPPTTELFMTRVLHILTERFPVMTLHERCTFLLIVQTITGSDNIYTNELIRMNILPLAVESVFEEHTMDPALGCISNICVDSSQVLDMLTKTGFVQKFYTSILEKNVYSPTCMYFVRCVINQTSEISIFRMLAPVAISWFLQKTGNDFILASLTLKDIVTRDVSVLTEQDIDMVFRKVIVESHTKPCYHLVRLIKGIAQQVRIPQSMKYAKELLEIESRQEDDILKKELFETVNAMIIKESSTNMAESIMLSSEFTSLLYRFPTVGNVMMQEEIIGVVVLCTIVAETQFILINNLLPSILNVITQIKVSNNFTLLPIILNVLMKLISEVNNIWDYLPDSTSSWLEKMLMTDQPAQVMSQIRGITNYLFPNTFNNACIVYK